MAIDNVREFKPRARYGGEEVYFADIDEFGVDGVRDILMICGVPSRRAALDAFWLKDQKQLTRHVTAAQSTTNRRALLAIRARFESARDEYRKRPIPSYVSSDGWERVLVAA